MPDSSAYYQYWGKSQPATDDNAIPEYHLLVYHCLDVAAVGQTLLTRNTKLTSTFAQYLGMSVEAFIEYQTFFLAVHDLGKFSETFQHLRPDVFKHLTNETCHHRTYSKHHDALGYFIWRKLNDGGHLTADIFGTPRDWRGIFDIWARVVTGHHGQPPTMVDSKTPLVMTFAARCLPNKPTQMPIM